LQREREREQCHSERERHVHGEREQIHSSIDGGADDQAIAACGAEDRSRCGGESCRCEDDQDEGRSSQAPESGTALHAAIVQAPEGTADNQDDMNNAGKSTNEVGKCSALMLHHRNMVVHDAATWHPLTVLCCMPPQLLSMRNGVAPEHTTG